MAPAFRIRTSETFDVDFRLFRRDPGGPSIVEDGLRNGLHVLVATFRGTPGRNRSGRPTFLDGAGKI